MSLLYRRIFFSFILLHIFTFSEKVQVFWMLLQYIGWFQHFYLTILTWQRGRGTFKKKFKSQKWKHWCFSKSQIFFTITPGQDGLGQKFMQKKKNPENHFTRWNMPKTGIKDSSKLVWLCMLPFKLTTKMAKEKMSADFLENF